MIYFERNRGYSSVGRASALQAECHRFESGYLHQFLTMKTTIKLKCAKCNSYFDKDLPTYKSDRQKPRPRYGKDKWFCSHRCSAMWSDSKSPFKHIFKNIRSRSKANKTELNIDLDYLRALWEKQEGRCAYTNLKMEMPVTHSQSKYLKKRSSPFTGSIDRIDSNQGYIKNNVHFICLALNYAKKDWTEEDFKAFLNALIYGEVVELADTTDLKSVEH